MSWRVHLCATLLPFGFLGAFKMFQQSFEGFPVLLMCDLIGKHCGLSTPSRSVTNWCSCHELVVTELSLWSHGVPTPI